MNEFPRAGVPYLIREFRNQSSREVFCHVLVRTTFFESFFLNDSRRLRRIAVSDYLLYKTAVVFAKTCHVCLRLSPAAWKNGEFLIFIVYSIPSFLWVVPHFVSSVPSVGWLLIGEFLIIYKGRIQMKLCLQSCVQKSILKLRFIAGIINFNSGTSLTFCTLSGFYIEISY